MISIFAIVSAAVFFVPTFLGTAFSLPLAITNTHGTAVIVGQLRKMLIWSVISTLGVAVFIFHVVDLQGHYSFFCLLLLIVIVPTEQFLINIVEQRVSVGIFINSRVLKMLILLLLTQVFLFYEFHLASLTIPIITANLVSALICFFALEINPFSKFSKSYSMNNTWKLIIFKSLSYISAHIPQLFLGRFLSPLDIAGHSNIQRLGDFTSGFVDRPLSSIVMQIANRKYSNDEDKFKFFIDVYSLQLISSFPVIIMFYVFSEHLFILLFGNRWVEYAPIFSIYVFGTLVNFVIPSVFQYFMSVNRLLKYLFTFGLRTVLLVIWAVYFTLSDTTTYQVLLAGIITINIFCSILILIIFLMEHKNGFKGGLKSYAQTALFPVCFGTVVYFLSCNLISSLDYLEASTMIQILHICLISALMIVFHILGSVLFGLSLRRKIISILKEI